MGRGKARHKNFTWITDKVSRQLLSCSLCGCNGHFKIPECVCYPSTYQVCIKDSQGIRPSTHKGELCHCLLITLAPCVIIINWSEPVSYCHHSKPVAFTLHLFISRSLHPAGTWNSWISCTQICPEFDNKTGKKVINRFFSSSSLKKVTKTWQRGFLWQVEDRRRNGSWSSNSEEVFSGKSKVRIYTLTYSCNTQNCSVLHRLPEDRGEDM